MPIVTNVAKERLAAGGLALGLGLRQARTVDIAMIAKISGFDWLFIDCEHNAMDLGTAVEISVAALGLEITPLVRVPGKEHHHATRVLDNGAMVVVVPHVETAAEAAKIVENCKYPPVGHRSIARAAPQVHFEPLPIDEFCRSINDNTLVVVMLESPRAIDNADAIAAVEGVDVLLIGSNDLCAEMGIHGQFGHERVAASYAAVIAACETHGKYAGMAGIRDDELAAKHIGMGARFVQAAVDVALLMEAGKRRTKFLRDLNPK